MVFLEVVDVQVFQEFDIDNRPIAVLNVGAFVKLGERLSDFEFRYLVPFNQDGLEVRHALPGLGNRLVQFALSDAVVRDQTIELGWVFLRDLAEIEKGDAECLCNLRDGFFVFSGESCSALFIEELEDAHQILVIRHDRIGQDLFRLESSPLVVGGVMEE